MSARPRGYTSAVSRRREKLYPMEDPVKSLMRLLSFGVASVLLLAVGCGVNTSSPGSSGPTGSAASIVYVIQNDPFSPGTSSILELPANGQGSVTPTATLNAPANTVFGAVAVDQSGNLYVGAVTGVVWEIFEYAAGATGVATPMRTIYLSSGFALLAVDSTGQIYTFGFSGINVFAANVSGNATPIRQIPATSTTLDYPFGIAVDSGQNIYIANAANILVFSSTANGNLAPARTITWSNSQFGLALYGVAVDTDGDIFAATYGCPPLTAIPCTSSSQILQFAPDSNGAATNVLTILPNANFPNSNTTAQGIAVDGAGNLYTQVTTITNLILPWGFRPRCSGGRGPVG